MKCHEGLARCTLKHKLSFEARRRDRSRALNGDTAHVFQGLSSTKAIHDVIYGPSMIRYRGYSSTNPSSPIIILVFWCITSAMI